MRYLWSHYTGKLIHMWQGCSLSVHMKVVAATNPCY